MADPPAPDAAARDAAPGDLVPPAAAEPGHPWSEPDRPRGLDAWFAPGGDDEAPPERAAEDRRMVRLLVLFVALLVGVPTVLTILAFAAQLATMRSGG